MNELHSLMIRPQRSGHMNYFIKTTPLAPLPPLTPPPDCAYLSRQFLYIAAAAAAAGNENKFSLTK